MQAASFGRDLEVRSQVSSQPTLKIVVSGQVCSVHLPEVVGAKKERQEGGHVVSLTLAKKPEAIMSYG